MHDLDARLARLSEAQHGMSTRAQAALLGLSDDNVDELVGAGVLIVEHRGVLRHQAHPWSDLGRLHAAVLACGDRAVASHRSAGRLHQLRDVPRWRPEVTVVGVTPRVRSGITVHRSDTLEAPDVAAHEGIPVTSVARTLLDLGAILPYERVELAAQDAIIRNRVTEVDLICVLERLGKRGRRGTAALRAVVLASLPPSELESRLELDLYRLIRPVHGEPEAVQHNVFTPAGAEYRLDNAWPSRMLAIEADGRRGHATKRDFERDLVRRRAIRALGWDHYSFGWADVHQRRAATVAELRRIFGDFAGLSPVKSPKNGW